MFSTTTAPMPIGTPSSKKCRIYVNEFDNVDPNNREEQVWSTYIYTEIGSTLIDNSYICTAGKDADENIGVDVPCELIGETIDLQRDADNTLRFIRGKETWTSADERRKILKDWWQPFDNQKNTRKRDTEFRFECRIDWGKPPTINIVL